jgi:quercetin dioxygenase-like cupin family protein
MKIESFNEEVHFNEDKINTQVILESSFTKKIRILFQQGSAMKGHQALYRIAQTLLEGKIFFGVNGSEKSLHQEDTLALEGNVLPNLTDKKDRTNRLTSYKYKKVKDFEGECALGYNAKVGYFAQNQAALIRS